MTEQAVFWINIDNPTQTIKIHCQRCRFLPNHETPYKGIGELRRDGGWLEFPTLEALQSYLQRIQHERPALRVRSCAVCS